MSAKGNPHILIGISNLIFKFVNFIGFNMKILQLEKYLGRSLSKEVLMISFTNCTTSVKSSHPVEVTSLKVLLGLKTFLSFS